MNPTLPDPAAMLTEVVLPGVVEPDGIVVQQRPVPVPGRNQALVRMLATGVSFAENAMRRNRYPGQPKFPFVLGYDLVGVVVGVGPGVDRQLVGRRVGAVVKTGGWSTHAVLDARDLVPLGDDVDPVAAEALLLNGITAWQMLHRKATVRAGQTILVHGASGGVGAILVQLARHAGIDVIGTGSPRHHAMLRELGATPLDYRDPTLDEQVRRMAPDGVQAVFDNIGGPSFRRSFGQLARGGTLLAYGTASQLEDTKGTLAIFAEIIAAFTLWNVLPNRRRAVFYNFWGGRRVTPTRFRRHLAADLNSVLELLADGAVTARIADRIPLREAARAMALADSRTVAGKVVLVP